MIDKYRTNSLNFQRWGPKLPFIYLLTTEFFRLVYKW